MVIMRWMVDGWKNRRTGPLVHAALCRSTRPGSWPSYLGWRCAVFSSLGSLHQIDIMANFPGKISGRTVIQFSSCPRNGGRMTIMNWFPPPNILPDGRFSKIKRAYWWLSILLYLGTTISSQGSPASDVLNKRNYTVHYELLLKNNYRQKYCNAFVIKCQEGNMK